MSGLTGEERELLRPREGCSQCAGLVWCPNCEDVMDQLAEAMDTVVARHVNAALLDAARFFEYDMAPAWGGDTRWLSTGSHVADLVASILRERAEDLGPDG